MARVVTKGSKANVRAGAAPTAPVVGSRSNGDQVDVLERKSGWVRIGTNQWISGEFVHEQGAASADGEVTPLKALPGWPDGRVLRAFGSGSADLKGKHKQWLDSFAIPRGKSGQRIWICGLTSRLGGAGENQQLSEKRATAVRDYLVKGGVPLAKIIGYVGQGEARAGGSATNDDPLDCAVMVCVTNDVIQLPTEYVTGRRLFGPIKW